jgi:tagaturonate reductase
MMPLNRISAGSPSVRPIKVLQFGDGNFLRGFADWVIDILNEKTAFNGDVVVVRPLRKDRKAGPDPQDGLYHILLNGLQQGQEVSSIRLITCLAATVNPYLEFDRYLKTGENPDLQFILSNTTEAGIQFNADDLSPDLPTESFPAKVTSLLYHRFKFFHGTADKGIILLPCELIESNGNTLKSIVLKYIDFWKLPDAFAQWIQECNIFCNSLVDRIVPGFPKDNLDEIQKRIGYDDIHLVSAEPFHLWVLEAPEKVQQLFPAHKVGLSVKYVDDLTPYRAQKVGILNGAHTSLVPVAYLHGLRTVKEAVDNDYTGKFIRETIFDEILPTLDLPQEELRKFADDTLERFQNPFIRHELKSIALNSISKFKVRVLPTILTYIKRTQKLPHHLLYSFAALIRFYKGEWKGEALPLNDSPDVIEFFSEAWQGKKTESVVRRVLSNTALWGEDLTGIEGLPDYVTKALNTLEATGTFEAMS